MLGVRPWSLGGLFDEDPARDREVASLSSRVDAVYAAALLLPPAFRAGVVETAEGLRATLADLREPRLSMEYQRAAERLEAMPAEVDRLEAMLRDASNAAYAARGRAAASAPGILDMEPPREGPSLAQVGLGLGALGAIGLGIWAAL